MSIRRTSHVGMAVFPNEQGLWRYFERSRAWFCQNVPSIFFHVELDWPKSEVIAFLSDGLWRREFAYPINF